MLHHLDAAEAEEKDREMHSWTLNNFRYSLYDFSLGVLFNAFVVLCYFNIIPTRSYRLSSILLLRLVRSFSLSLSLLFRWLFAHCRCCVFFLFFCMFCTLLVLLFTIRCRIVASLFSQQQQTKLGTFPCLCSVYVCTFNNINCLVDWLSVVAWNR